MEVRYVWRKGMNGCDRMWKGVTIAKDKVLTLCGDFPVHKLDYNNPRLFRFLFFPFFSLFSFHVRHCDIRMMPCNIIHKTQTQPPHKPPLPPPPRITTPLSLVTHCCWQSTPPDATTMVGGQHCWTETTEGDIHNTPYTDSLIQTLLHDFFHTHPLTQSKISSSLSPSPSHPRTHSYVLYYVAPEIISCKGHLNNLNNHCNSHPPSSPPVTTHYTITPTPITHSTITHRTIHTSVHPFLGSYRHDS